ncbi:MAG: nucleotidyltransferase domain-containing protein [Pseudomonadota bacterium]|nr:nucleotidyltransferase domain-containing protein [Pseudomonadota bacterium]
MREERIRRKDALEVLRRYKREFDCQYGVTALGVFGSIARDEGTKSSDVDVVVKMREPDLFSLVHIKETLEDAFHGRVDIVHYRDRMNAFLKNRIDRDAVYV